jgi:hypothetical protein
MSWFWTWYDQFFSINRAETAVWLLSHCDEDDIVKNRTSLNEFVERANKRMKHTTTT